MVRGDVGVEIGLGAVDADLAQQAGIGQLVERVVDGRQRHRNLGERRFLVEHFRRQVARALAEQQPAQRHALPGRPQAGGLQHFIDVVPGTAGQRRLAPGSAGAGSMPSSFKVEACRSFPRRAPRSLTRAIFSRNIRRKSGRCKFFATRTGPRLSGTRRATRRFTLSGALPARRPMLQSARTTYAISAEASAGCSPSSADLREQAFSRRETGPVR